MIDLKTVEFELQQARRARIEAEEAGIEIEALIAQSQREPRRWARPLFVVAGPPAEAARPGHA